MARLSHALAAVAVLTLVGCGAQPQSLTGTRLPASAVKAADESDHQQMNAIVRGTLTEYQGFAFEQLDANHDGAISKAEYGRSLASDAVALFFKSFDGNKDGTVTSVEYACGLKTDDAVEAYHHFTEERMSKAIKPYMADKNFEASELRDYITKDLGQSADWPQIFELMDKLDLNKDDKLISGPGEGPAFMLTFAKPQLQQALGVPAELSLKLKRRK
jgi:hypothetical protein